MAVPSEHEQWDLAVIGAGPHALTLCSYLLRLCPQLHERLVVVDPGGWLSSWQYRLDALGIDRLRSHYTDHPHPDPYALWQFSRGHPQQQLGMHYTPGTALFADFCRTLVTDLGLGQVLRRGRAERIDTDPQGLCVNLADGTAVRARKVVFAANPVVPRLPAWASGLAAQAPPGRIVHTEQLDVRELSLEGERILVLGSGLTAGQLTLHALAEGAHVVMATRDTLRVSVFDVRGCWQGPPCLRGFHTEPDPRRRLQWLQTALPGGSLTPLVAQTLREAAAQGTVELVEGCAIPGAVWSDDQWQITTGDRIWEVDRIWLATGTTLGVDATPLLDGVAAQRPIKEAGGLPMLDRACRWPGTSLHVMGGLAGLQLGPFARNLIGARMGAERIVSDITPLRRRQYPRPPR
ncbi:MAG: FAD/NAD(P)-binding protein [Pseudonocardiaceae bacterium]